MMAMWLLFRSVCFDKKVSMLEVPLLTEDQCRVVAEATAEAVSVPEFVPTSSLFDPSTEVPVQDLPAEVCVVQSVVCAGSVFRAESVWQDGTYMRAHSVVSLFSRF